jgi:hypothetical protein
MSTKFVMLDKVARVEEKFAKQWVSGTGQDAVFRSDSAGWYATFTACPASMYLGTMEPGLKAGDRVRITMERV